MNAVNEAAKNTWTMTWFLIPNWKWVALVVAVIGGMLLQKALKIVFRKAKTHPRFRRMHSWVNHFLTLPVESPLAWVLTSVFLYFALDTMDLGGNFNKYLRLCVHLIQAFALIRLAYLAVDAVGFWIEEVVKKTPNTLDDQLAPLATKTFKVLIIIFGILVLLQSFDVNVMSLLAGLGLGGLALALAAQDTAANFFGSITIILDRPFVTGDWVKVGDTEGVVEEIGFRSTSIRTFYNSVVTVPNAIMAKEKIDNMGSRRTGRLRHVLGITYDTPNESIRKFIERIKYMLMQQPEVVKDNIRVTFHQMGDFNLQILVQCFLSTLDAQEEAEIQEQLLLEIKAIAEEMKVEFAFPTQTLYLHRTPVTADASAGASGSSPGDSPPGGASNPRENDPQGSRNQIPIPPR